MFMTEEEDDMIVINLADADAEKQINPSQTNFWKALSPVFQSKPLSNGVMEL
jgi:hypothetical protein